MSERGILFSAPMVRALLDGSKTQTRRAIKLPHMNPLGKWEPSTFGGPDGGRTRTGQTVPLQGCIWHTRTGDSLGSPHGQPGDRLWVRETWMELYELDDEGGLTCLPPTGESSRKALRRAKYRADGEKPASFAANWKPSIFMPRWASRITLDITGVRAERLQDISEADAKAEGIAYSEGMKGWHVDDGKHFHCVDPRQSYFSLWDAINGPGAVEANPFVWVIEFKRV